MRAFKAGRPNALIDLVGVSWLMIDEEPSAAPNGGSVCV
jgi:hypothetical protein